MSFISSFSCGWARFFLGIFCSQVASGLFCGGSARLLGVQMLLAVSIIGWSLVTQR